MTPLIEKTMREVMEVITAELERELTRQGHNNTGALVKSFETKIKITSAAVVGEIHMNKYWQYLNDGVPAHKIPYRKGSGKKASKYIAALIDYLISKGYFKNVATSYAFATANKHKQEGMPTKASFRFSTNNKRLNFLTDTVAPGSATMQNVEAKLETALQSIVDTIVLKTSINRAA